MQWKIKVNIIITGRKPNRHTEMNQHADGQPHRCLEESATLLHGGLGTLRQVTSKYPKCIQTSRGPRPEEGWRAEWRVRSGGSWPVSAERGVAGLPPHLNISRTVIWDQTGPLFSRKRHRTVYTIIQRRQEQDKNCISYFNYLKPCHYF
jgi:hypothetical protein